MNEELSELTYEEFVRARKLFWQERQSSARKDASLPASDGAAAGEENGSFMLYSPGPKGIFAVFEDSDQKGWFYLYGAKEAKILKCSHIYDRANFTVDEDVVDIGWASDGSACGLAVWGEFRAFLGVSTDLEIRKPVMDSEERGIPGSEWPAGFERFIEKKID